MENFWEQVGAFAPVIYLIIFFLSTFIMIWRLHAMENRGLQGTVIGTVIMPYCSGLPNLIFAWVLGQQSDSDGQVVLENCLVNNVTNLTLLIGLPAVIWGMNVASKSKAKAKAGGKKSKKKDNKKAAPAASGKELSEEQRINRLSLLLTLTAILFFTGALWALGKDEELDHGDGLVLIGIFIFWQFFHIFDVKKYNISKKQKLSPMILFDVALLIAGGYGTYISIDALVTWIVLMGDGFIGSGGLGWLSAWLMVLPNATLAFYFAAKKRADIAYTSQVGDGHICIPLCIGLYAYYKSIALPESFHLGILLILGATVLHIFFVMFLGRLTRWMGLVFTLSYFYFIYQGLISP